MVKIKNRYYLVRMMPNDGSDPDVTKGNIFQEIIKATGEMFGDVGYSIIKMSLSVRVIDEDVVVIRVASAGEKYLSVILPCILKISKQPMVLHTIFVGRSMRACEKRLITVRRDELYKKFLESKTNAQKAFCLDALRKSYGGDARIFDDSEFRPQDLLAQ